MKREILMYTLVRGVVSLFAQTNQEGKVVYEEVQKMNFKLEGDTAQFAHALPKERKSKKELVFTATESMYKKFDGADDTEDVAMEHGGMAIQMRMVEPDNQFYVDIKKQKTIEKREFMTRNFLIAGEVDASGWKISGEQKTILDYACQQAIKTDEEGNETIAWFAPSIPVSTGPSANIGLPGLVLEVTSMDGDNTVTAISIELAAVSKDSLVKPKKGKKVSREEFDQIVKEKMEEMGAQQGEGGGTFIMKIER